MVAKYLFSLLVLLAFYGAVSAETIHVGKGQALTTIHDGLIACQKGDTLLINSGTYIEGNIIVDKSIFIQGVNYPILDGAGNTEVLTITADDVSIVGLHIRGVGTSYTEDRAGIRIRKSNNFLIRANLLEDTFFGIYLESAKNGVIEDNRVFGNAIQEMSSGNAIHLWKCSNVQIKSNHVKKHRDGIYFEFVDNSVVEMNVSEDNLRYGLHFMFSNDDNYYDNTFQRNGAGVAVMFSRNIEMKRNTFRHNWGSSSYGLLLKEISDAIISDNHFNENSIAIYVEGGVRLTYTNNNFVSNGWAFKISGGCVGMMVSQNNFIGNTFDISINSAMNDNLFEENYWSEYSGYDLDRDGLGDIPYRPVKLFNYVINRTPESIVLLRSLFIDILNFSEKVNPTLTPKNVMDLHPRMRKILF